MEIAMTSYENGKPAMVVTALANEDLDSVIGGCVGVPVIVKGGEVIYVSPTTGWPHFPIGTGPIYPTGPRGPFPL